MFTHLKTILIALFILPLTAVAHDIPMEAVKTQFFCVGYYSQRIGDEFTQQGIQFSKEVNSDMGVTLNLRDFVNVDFLLTGGSIWLAARENLGDGAKFAQIYLTTPGLVNSGAVAYASDSAISDGISGRSLSSKTSLKTSVRREGFDRPVELTIELNCQLAEMN